MIKILSDPQASEFQKAKACQRSGELGAKEAVPALAALLGHPHLSTYARYGLEPIADPAADHALRSALPKLKGDLLIGVINTVGKRRDAGAAPELNKLLYASDSNVSRAAAMALGSIGGESSMKALQAGLSKSKGPARVAFADASLICAERLLAQGNREQGLALYASLTNAGVPKAARLAAMEGIIREETATGRPR